MDLVVTRANYKSLFAVCAKSVSAQSSKTISNSSGPAPPPSYADTIRYFGISLKQLDLKCFLTEDTRGPRTTQSALNSVGEQKAVEIAADWMTVFYGCRQANDG